MTTGLINHAFMAKWQKEQFNNLLTNLPLNHIICVHDFSENYTCRSQDEIQSRYFDPNKVSFHVTILYRHADLLQDGKQSTVDEPCIIKEHVFALSDDNTQDYNFVHHVLSQILTYLREQHHLTVDKIHEFTDGCAGQYKSKHTFGDLSCCLADFGVQIDRHFFETSMQRESKMLQVPIYSNEPLLPCSSGKPPLFVPKICMIICLSTFNNQLQALLALL